MGILRRRERLTAATVTLPGSAPASISSIPAEIAQAFGINTSLTAVTRKEAMSLPVVRQGRHMIAGTIGTFPLICERGDTPIRRDLLEQPDWTTTRGWTVTWTVDDLMFYGIAWWLVTARDSLGYPVRATRIARNRLQLDATSQTARVDGIPVNPSDLIRFDGPDEGILAAGVRALRTAIRLEDAVQRFAVLDVPTGVLKDTRPGHALKQDEVDELLTRWSSARAKHNTGYLNGSLDYQPVAFNAQQLQLTEARQHMALELARLMGLDAGAVNAPTATGSVTYENGVAERRARVDQSFRQYMAPIADRLSLPDVTPRGQTVRWDTSDYLRGDAAEAIAAAVQAAGAPVMSIDEARWRLLDMPAQQSIRQDTNA